MKTYIPLADMIPTQQFAAGKADFYRGIAFSFEYPVAWRRGWQAAFSEVMREHEAAKNDKA